MNVKIGNYRVLDQKTIDTALVGAASEGMIVGAVGAFAVMGAAALLRKGARFVASVVKEWDAAEAKAGNDDAENKAEEKTENKAEEKTEKKAEKKTEKKTELPAAA